jgi:hypothetical protein
MPPPRASLRCTARQEWRPHAWQRLEHTCLRGAQRDASTWHKRSISSSVL